MFSPTEIYSPYDKRMQTEERARFMRWQRSDWLQSVEDEVFQHTMLGVTAIHFSGDHRPDAHPSELESRPESA